jgi:Flp pilus assembly protein TadB
VAVLEVVVRGSLVVGTRFFEHFVKNAPTGGSSRLLAVSGSDKVVSRGFALALLVLLFLLPVASLGAPVGALGFLVLALSLILVTTKDGTDRLLTGGIVGDDVH